MGGRVGGWVLRFLHQACKGTIDYCISPSPYIYSAHARSLTWQAPAEQRPDHSCWGPALHGPGLATHSPLAAHAWHCPSHCLLAGLLHPVACGRSGVARRRGVRAAG